MGRIRVADGAALPWLRPPVGRRPDEADMSIMVEVHDDLVAAARFLHEGGPGRLQLFEVRLPPGAAVEPHAHAHDEIIYVLQGALRLGARDVGPGCAIEVPGGTLYGFRAGTAGVRFLNFRAEMDLTFFTKDEFVDRRRGS